MAYYAAVNALNCATYWDTAVDSSGVDYYPFGSFTWISSSPTFNVPSPNPKPIVCAGSSPASMIVDSVANGSTYSFTLSFPQAIGGPSQAEVKVIQGNGSNGAAAGATFITVNGYNTSNSSHPRRVQRSLDSN